MNPATHERKETGLQLSLLTLEMFFHMFTSKPGKHDTGPELCHKTLLYW